MDQALSRRLERTEATIGTSFTDVRQRLTPALGTVWRDFDGTYAIFDGADSPMTQTFGLGLFGSITPDTLAEIEAFFSQRGADVQHEVSPLAGLATTELLVDRGYRPCELSTVLARPIADVTEPPAAHALRVRAMTPADRDAWVETSVTGWAEDPAFAPLMRSMAEVASANHTMTHFMVERDGMPIATASMGIHDGVVLLAGASTIPAGRGVGCQGLLLAARLAEAKQRGCEIAMMVSSPGSTSQRNAERSGFRVAYTRTKWRLPRHS